MEFNKILVPITGTEVDREVIELACRLIGKKGQVFVVYTIAVDRTLPIDAEVEPEVQKADSLLTEIETMAGERGWPVETDLLQARELGPAIINAAMEGQADLIIVGLTPLIEFGQFSVGSMVPYLLKNTPCRVLLYQEPIAGEQVSE